MSRYASRPAALHYSFGPGPITPAVKWLIIANVAMFLATLVYDPIMDYLGLSPELVVERQWLWQLVTYLFLHGGAVHILFNMLGIWMFGVELERLWGTRQFVKYYAITGIGAGLTVMAVGLLPFELGRADLPSATRSAHPARCTGCWSPSRSTTPIARC